MTADSPLLDVDQIHVEFAGRRRHLRNPLPIRAVNGVSISIERGSTYGLVGESGSGKSTLARAILQLVHPTSGTVNLDGERVTMRTAPDRRAFRQRVQAVLQDPYASLNRSHPVSAIVGDPMTLHRGVRKGKERDALVVELLDKVGLNGSFLGRHPYQMSGGQCQRVSIARALAVGPDLIVADEVTSALDVSVQSQVLNLLSDIQDRDGLALLLIAHNLEVVEHMSDHVGVMYLGYLVESGPARRLYQQPAHPYTEMLIASSPVPDPVAQQSRRAVRRSYPRDAEPPSPARLPPGCPFANRCPLALEVCSLEMPGPTPAAHGGFVRCHLHTSGPQLGGQSVVELLGVGLRGREQRAGLGR
jgi:oligopeptide/dipeptide ABC transporter ATP-binding protein